MPSHDFFLMPEKAGDYSAYIDCFGAPGALKLHDDIICYTIDTLKWVPSINPSNPTQWGGYGLNYYGPTVINKAGAGKAARVFRLWSELFDEGPAVLELTGPFEWVHGEPIESGRFAVITTPRELLVKSLSDVADLAETAASGDHYLLHIGI
jgi:hypothetical protein